MRISDWSSDVCSSDLLPPAACPGVGDRMGDGGIPRGVAGVTSAQEHESALPPGAAHRFVSRLFGTRASVPEGEVIYAVGDIHGRNDLLRSEEHTSELQSLMRISYAVFCLKKKNNKQQTHLIQ